MQLGTCQRKFVNMATKVSITELVVIAFVCLLSIGVEGLMDKPALNLGGVREETVGRRAIVSTIDNTNNILPDTSEDKKPPKYEPSNNNNPIGKGFYLPEVDLYSERVGGTPIFDFVHKNCLKVYPNERDTREKLDYFENTQHFYNSIASATSLDLSVTGQYTMGTTLNTKSSSLTTGSTDVRGSSLRLWTHTHSDVLDDACFRLPDSPLSSTFINELRDLPLVVTNPEYKGSWERYETFMKTFGSHIVTKSHQGSSIRLWSFSKVSHSYSETQIIAASCGHFHGPTKLGSLGVDLCGGVTQEDINQASNHEVSFHINIQGGTDTTRNQLANQRTKDLLVNLMNEGRANPASIDYNYIAIWLVIEFKYQGHDQLSLEMRAKAENLRQFYQGFMDFGCSMLKVNNVKMRSFRAIPGRSTSLVPLYECWMERQGCRSNNDCHIGGAGTVTYCYGSTCMEHVQPSFGKKALSARAKTWKSGSYRSGLNRTCYYKTWKIAGYCHSSTSYYSAFRIWP